MNLFWFMLHFFLLHLADRSNVIIKVAIPPETVVQIIANSELVWFHGIFIMWYSYVYEHRKIKLKIRVAVMFPSCMNLTVADNWHSFIVRCTLVGLSSVLPSSYPVLPLGLGIALTKLTINIIWYESSRKDTTKQCSCWSGKGGSVHAYGKWHKIMKFYCFRVRH
jgi:hypothetical protein